MASTKKKHTKTSRRRPRERKSRRHRHKRQHQHKHRSRRVYNNAGNIRNWFNKTFKKQRGRKSKKSPRRYVIGSPRLDPSHPSTKYLLFL